MHEMILLAPEWSGSRNAGIGIKSLLSISISFVVNFMDEHSEMTKSMILADKSNPIPA